MYRGETLVAGAKALAAEMPLADGRGGVSLASQVFGQRDLVQRKRPADLRMEQPLRRRVAPAGKKRPQPKLPDLKTQEDKLKFLEMIRLSMPTRKIGSSIRYTSADLDKALNLQIGLSSGNYAPVIDDETFLRRATLDLTGQVPTPAEIRKFVADPDPRKRAAKIDELLETPEYARKWARYWRSVIFFNSNANRNRINPQALEDWFAEQFENNVSWDRITAELVSAGDMTSGNRP